MDTYTTTNDLPVEGTGFTNSFHATRLFYLLPALLLYYSAQHHYTTYHYQLLGIALAIVFMLPAIVAMRPAIEDEKQYQQG